MKKRHSTPGAASRALLPKLLATCLLTLATTMESKAMLVIWNFFNHNTMTPLFPVYDYSILNIYLFAMGDGGNMTFGDYAFNPNTLTLTSLEGDVFKTSQALPKLFPPPYQQTSFVNDSGITECYGFNGGGNAILFDDDLSEFWSGSGWSFSTPHNNLIPLEEGSLNQQWGMVVTYGEGEEAFNFLLAIIDKDSIEYNETLKRYEYQVTVENFLNQPIWSDEWGDYLLSFNQGFKTIPEPSAALLLGVGVVIAGLRRRRR